MDIVESFMKMYINQPCAATDTLQKLLNVDLSDVNIRKKNLEICVGAKLLIIDYKKCNRRGAEFHQVVDCKWIRSVSYCTNNRQMTERKLYLSLIY